MPRTVKPIGYIKTDFKEKFGIPRQSGQTELLSTITFEKEFSSPSAIKGIEGFSHLWIIFDFSLAHTSKFSSTVRPPRLGGNTRVGVFASRSPFRPNSLGLSLVKLISVQNGSLIVSGADLLDGTPIYDIKPYLPYADFAKDAFASYADEHKDDKIEVVFPKPLLKKIPEDKQDGLIKLLSLDPRPSYQDDGKEYGMRFSSFNVRFKVEQGVLTVFSVECL